MINNYRKGYTCLFFNSCKSLSIINDMFQRRHAHDVTIFNFVWIINHCSWMLYKMWSSIKRATSIVYMYFTVHTNDSHFISGMELYNLKKKFLLSFDINIQTWVLDIISLLIHENYWLSLVLSEYRKCFSTEKFILFSRIQNKNEVILIVC